MPRICTVCAHRERLQIDRCLVSGQSNRSIAKQFGLDDAAVFRHRNAHLPAEVAKAQEAEEATRADDLLAQSRTLYAKALAVLDRAEERHDDRLALGAIREAGNTLRLLGEVLGRLQQGAQVNVLVASPEWAGLQARIVAALAPYPDVWAAVQAAITNGQASPNGENPLSRPSRSVQARAGAPAARLAASRVTRP